MLVEIQRCMNLDRYFYTKHARDEMEFEELGEIREVEVFEAVGQGKMIEGYPDDEPYPSCLIYGRTSGNRPLHIVCAYSAEEEVVIIITVYEPHSSR